MKQLLLTSIAIIALALSGCADSGDPAPEGTQDTATQDPTDDAEGTQTETTTQEQLEEEAESNTPPTAELTADVLNGTAPLAVNFTIDGSDADGDNLTWELTLNGTALANGTQLPGQANATFEAAGNFTVFLTVSDGTNATTTALNITVLAGAPSGPEPLFEVFDLGEGCELCVDGSPAFNGANGCVGWHLQREGMDCAWLAFGEEYEGTPFSVFSYTDGNLPLVGTDGNPDIEFRDGCGTDSAQISKQWTGSGDTEVGTVPEGARCIVAYEFHWPNLGHTIEISIGADVHS